MTGIALSSRTGKFIVTAAVLGSGMAMLDSTVVNVALLRIGQDLDASLADLQWISNGYLLSLASLILLGGSLGDRFGRRRVFLVGVVWFAAASAACGLAQSPVQLIIARVLQGVGGALLTPGSLSIIQATFQRADRATAIGAWSGLGGISAAIGPFVGGWLVQYASWRWASAPPTGAACSRASASSASACACSSRRSPRRSSTRHPTGMPGWPVA